MSEPAIDAVTLESIEKRMKVDHVPSADFSIQQVEQRPVNEVLPILPRMLMNNQPDFRPS